MPVTTDSTYYFCLNTYYFCTVVEVSLIIQHQECGHVQDPGLRLMLQIVLHVRGMIHSSSNYERELLYPLLTYPLISST